MPTIQFTQTLQNEYEDLYNHIEIRLDKLSAVENNVNKILQYKARYQGMGAPLKKFPGIL